MRWTLHPFVATVLWLAGCGAGAIEVRAAPASPHPPPPTSTAVHRATFELMPSAPAQIFGGTSPDALALGGPLVVYELDCLHDSVAHTFSCHPAAGLLPHEGADPVRTQTHDLARVEACFRVDVRRADAALVSGYEQLTSPLNGLGVQERMRTLAERAEREGPSLYVVHQRTRERVVECPPCGGRDCCLGQRNPPSHIETHETIESRSLRVIMTPQDRPSSGGTMAVVDATPRARTIADLAQQGRFADALEVARADVAAAQTPRARAFALANVMVAGTLGGDEDAVRGADAELAPLPDAAEARSHIPTAVGVAAGLVWLRDPCASVRP